MSPTEPCSTLAVNPSNVNLIIVIRCAIFHRCCSLFNCNTRTLPSSRCRASLAHLRQSRLDCLKIRALTCWPTSSKPFK